MLRWEPNKQPWIGYSRQQLHHQKNWNGWRMRYKQFGNPMKFTEKKLMNDTSITLKSPRSAVKNGKELLNWRGNQICLLTNLTNWLYFIIVSTLWSQLITSQSKLVPNWGQSPQPGSTYYLQKLSHEKTAVYLLDERVGPKNTDHTISYATHFISQLPDWLRRIHLFLDNTCATNKNWYMIAWVLELVQHGKLDFLCVINISNCSFLPFFCKDRKRLQSKWRVQHGRAER